MMLKMDKKKVKRHGNHIRIASGITAIEGREGGLPTLTIRKDGVIVKEYKGSSLIFLEELTDEDKSYLVSLVK